MLFHRGGNTVHGIAFDCGTLGVHAALFSYSKTDAVPKPEILQVSRVPFGAGMHIDTQIFRRKTREGLRRIIKEVPFSFRPQEILIGLSSPFYISKTVHIIQKREDAAKPIISEELQALRKRTEDAFTEETKKRVGGDAIVLFTARVLKTYVNGYRVENPIGSTGTVLELFLHFEATTQVIQNDFIACFAGRFPLLVPRFVSIPLAHFYVLSNIFDAEAGFLVIDIGGEVSDISLTVNGVLERISTLPFGSNMFLRQATALLHISSQDASFIVSRYAEHTLESSYMKRLEPLITDFRTMWRERLLTVLGLYAEQYEIPSRVLCTGGGVLPFHQELFLEDVWDSFVPQKKMIVSVATPAFLENQFSNKPFRDLSDFNLASLVLLEARNIV